MHEFVGKNQKNKRDLTTAARRGKTMITTIAIFSIILNIVVICSFAFQSVIQTNNDSRLNLAMARYDLVVDIMLNFKWTVQSWKDILLRGHNLQDREKYSQELINFHNMTFKKSFELKKITDDQDHIYIDNFLNLEEDLLSDYTTALAIATNAKDFDYRSADRSVRGKDRKVLVPLVEELMKRLDSKLKGDARYNSGLTKKVQIAVTALLIIMSCGLATFATIIAKQRMRQDEQFEIQNAKLRLLGEISANIIHDIRNPITIIDGRCEQITSLVKNLEPSQNKVLGLVEGIQKTSNRIATIVGSINRFTRQTADLAYETTLISQIIDESTAIITSKFSSYEIDLKRGDIDQSLTIMCRSVEICQVLVNLLINGADAVHSLDERWVRIDTADRGDYAEIIVTDSGHGIDKKNLSKMSQAFFTTKKLGHGTGQGIAITRAIITRHNGYFCYDDTSSHTCFIIGIPKKNCVPIAA